MRPVGGQGGRTLEPRSDEIYGPYANEGFVAFAVGWSGRETPGRRTAHRSRRSIPPRSAFAGFRFPSDVIVLAVCCYLRFGLSYRDLEELLAERGVEVDHITIYLWVLRFTLLLPTPPGPADIAWEIAGRWTRLL
jgi:hypothetical protein